MICTIIKSSGYDIKLYSLNTVVVGTGAAGFNAADRLYSYGQKDIAVVTEHIEAGTSRNTGSDKQTYYKLTLSGSDPDSVGEMAGTLFDGKCVDGDIALAEAALSAQCFYKLVEIGVPFPHNRFGEYIGYKTDHDPRRRAASAGPYTSRMMTECLEHSVKEKGIKIFDKLLVIKILTDGKKLAGLLCLNLANPKEKNERFVAFNCRNIVYATGGPAGMYADSAYPFGQYGATGIAFEAGVMGRNLTEWQYGLASVKPRWNVSGTFMQVLPKFISTDSNGGDVKEFLYDFFTDEGEMLTRVFLKGYQWPFDVRKLAGGSSIIDLLVYIEVCMKGRRVFLDYRTNPGGREINYSALSAEVREYLERAGATFGTPAERLLHMNAPAVGFYRDKGVDLLKEPLEIALCAQHNNGGLAIDRWWRTNIDGFFAAGEVSSSHGVYRPGGSALNAGQVGSTRAAQFIAANCRGEPPAQEAYEKAAAESIAAAIAMGESAIGAEENVGHMLDATAKRMSRYGAAIRSAEGIRSAIAEVKEELGKFRTQAKVTKFERMHMVYRLYDILLCQYVYLSAMADYAANGGKSRGSAMYFDKDGACPYPGLPDMFRCTLDDSSRGNTVQEVLYRDGGCSFNWRAVREIPEEDDFFENVWRSFRENGNIY